MLSLAVKMERMRERERERVCCLWKSKCKRERESMLSLEVKMEGMRERGGMLSLAVKMERMREREREREREYAVSGSQNVRERVLGRREYVSAILVMRSAPNARDKIKVADVVMSTNHLTFLANRFPKLISLPTSTIFVSGTSGFTAILK